MASSSDDTSYFSSICIEHCKGSCCDPWWGIISYQLVKEGALSNLNSFRVEIIKGIKARAQRITDCYTTKEFVPRHLFDHPEKYNVTIKDVKVNGNTLLLNVLAMFAFRCRYLSPEKICLIHPAITDGEDIRPPHCGFMGSLRVKPGEKGYCRVIHTAESVSRDINIVNSAIKDEKDASEKHLNEGFSTVDLAADNLITQLKEYCSRNFSYLLPQNKQTEPGRNDPCHCGSGRKYKKCHGAANY